MSPTLDTEIAAHIWATRYQAAGEDDVGATLDRVARAAASVEPSDRPGWARRFRQLMEDLRFMPAGRILAGAGVDRRVTLFNCFVMGQLEDSLQAIFRSLGESAMTLQHGGGIGLDFSSLRPAGWVAKDSGTVASGPVSFIRVWDAMSEAMQSGGNRRGAMMATLRCDHPDIEAFIKAKNRPDVLSHCNLSVQVTDAFIHAVQHDLPWSLRFPAGGDGREHARVSARALWAKLAATAAEASEPGVLFVDTINRENNLAYREWISATNPCGEVPLPAWGACNLGSINLTHFVKRAFTAQAALDFDGIGETAALAVRLLDNVIDVSRFPLAAQAREARSTRRVGLGVTGLADALIMLGLRYDQTPARDAAREVLECMRDRAYRASVELASEKGAFPALDVDAYLERPFIRRLDRELQQDIRRFGIRNSHSLSIAPTGTISLLAGNISSGIEPVYAPTFSRTVRTGEQDARFELEDAACRRWRLSGLEGTPGALVVAGDIRPEDHLAMLAALQPLVDNGISKTIPLGDSVEGEGVSDLFLKAHGMGLKGVTVYRTGHVRGSVVQQSDCAALGACEL
ncbi:MULTISPECIES: adenosylcobalamin-dependent ribonucleoside-diphosphate reductase [unclassified Wenzhouxiangella]|uniref:adenosylcobalamin-dependent ribonucleoside-diphosphate reductase n=1 Tax=unclassified Wenzhouxiangella TaxID=2613841 RepID=UPI000E32B3F7|nr:MULTISPECIES: adenosylcobalamin-dependent ribonucleoside-diphosphate reductase [unclassified Wenzhouxiangella]RFF26845.1 adenosylcobalamin-dependent ribonucleoside-diphosphate reductase [Wenzhouxiangella sp. 15181]RFP68502.1 adenosylcobalamin-dependent ribonucleoside-diphosphate reductase [Wenzhouxiangella sp. 15190]